MKFFLLGIVVGAAAIILFLVFVGRPRKHRDVSYEQLPALLRRLALSLHDRGRIYIGHSDSTGTIWIQKRVRKTKPSTITFRYRNTSDTKASFPAVADAFERQGVAVDIELTKVRRQPRAVRVEFDAEQAATYAGIASLARVAFEAVGANREGRLVVHADDSFGGTRSKAT